MEHNFDPTIGKFGIPRGDYEVIARDVLYENGHVVILESEKSGRNIRVAEGLLDGKLFDIKGIEGTGEHNIFDKIKDTSNKGANTIVLFYPNKNIFSMQKIIDDYSKYLRTSKSQKIKDVYYIVDEKLYKL